MKRHSQNGVALVISLIMLSVVTFMAIAFLALSRRERSSVSVTVDQTTAGLMADAALAQAESEIMARMRATTNAGAYEFFVSTNMIDPNGFASNPNPNPNNTGIYTNVNFDYVTSANQNFRTPLNEAQRIENIGRLLYYPRPPVYVRTNFQTRILNQAQAPLDFRYYVDFNRDGKFEPTGWQAVTDYNNNKTPALDSTGAPIPNKYLSNYFVGDPQWVGMLEKPDQPHSAKNKFVGRWAYIAVPEGKTLDLNLIHNQAKRLPNTAPTYYRNQGIAPWEMNLAAFLCDVHTNQWPTNAYRYMTNLTVASQNQAFLDAMNIVKRRGNLSTVRSLFGNRGANAFMDVQPFDAYTDGPPIGTNKTLPFAPVQYLDDPDRGWPGSEAQVPYTDIQQLLTLNTDFSKRINGTFDSRDNSTYNAYTFYRTMAQLGVNSSQASDTRIHLNYKNIDGFSATNFQNWRPIEFFTTTAERLFRTQLQFADIRYNFGITNIPIYPTNYYTATIHRMLQLSANIFDATTNKLTANRIGPPLPSVFRPLVRKNLTNSALIEICGYVEVTNAVTDVLNRRWIDLNEPADRQRLTTDDMVYGVPLIIGAKKGYPNFNEFAFETRVEVSRKLKAVGPPKSITRPRYEQMYVLGISNSIGLEAWNSYSDKLYTNGFPRNLQLRVTNIFTMAITNRGTSAPIYSLPTYAFQTNIFIPQNTWIPRQFKLPINTNFAYLRNASYLSATARFSTNAGDFAFDPNPNFPTPQWGLAASNRLVYILLDVDEPANPKIVDFVNVRDLTANIDIASDLVNTNASGEVGLNGSLWATNMAATGKPLGIENQLQASMGKWPNLTGIWRNSSGDVVSGIEREKAIDKFLVYLGLTPRVFSQADMDRELVNTRVMQVPFSPSRTFFQTLSWQANDPLVHYTIEDLVDPQQSREVQYTTLRSATSATLGGINHRYRPWGDSHVSGDSANQYNLAIKDPGVLASDDWDFPTNKFPSIGLLGRVHRGTPWQTIYMKSTSADMRVWRNWAVQPLTHPTNDYRLFDLFTTAPSPYASRGLLSVNQTNIAAWSAALSGVSVLVRTNATSPLMETNIGPNSPELRKIVDSINLYRTAYPWGSSGIVLPRLNYEHVGDILSAPALTVESPFVPKGTVANITDREYERIPEMVLSLLKADEPRMVIYTFGQSLAPAGPPVISPGTPQHLMYTNYQITGEVVTKNVLRVDQFPTNPIVARERFEFVPNE